MEKMMERDDWNHLLKHRLGGDRRSCLPPSKAEREVRVYHRYISECRLCRRIPGVDDVESKVCFVLIASLRVVVGSDTIRL
jgi:hypothetical protein